MEERNHRTKKNSDFEKETSFSFAVGRSRVKIFGVHAQIEITEKIERFFKSTFVKNYFKMNCNSITIKMDVLYSLDVNNL